MMMTEKKCETCNECKFAFFEDYGYSNYTVEGTTFTCLKNLHPDGSFDRFYGKDEKLQYAQKCPQFTKGKPIEMDCDREAVHSLSPEQEKLLKDHGWTCFEWRERGKERE